MLASVVSQGTFPLCGRRLPVLFAVAAWGLAAAVMVAGWPMSRSMAAQESLPTQLVFAFQKQTDPAAIQESAAKVASFLSNEVGIPVKVFVPTDYAASVQAMVSRQADILYTDSIPFLLARRDAGAQLLLAEQRADAHANLRTDYDSIFVVRKDSPLETMDDLVARAAELRMAFTSPTSTSGYVMAYRRLVHEDVLEPRQDPRMAFKSVAFGGSYTLALRQVVEGRADVCAVSFYTLEGERADVYLPAEERQQLRVLARTPGVPTHVISIRGELSDELKDRVKAALLKLSREQGELLEDVYGTASFVEVDEQQHVAATVEALEYLGIDAGTIVNR